MKHNIDINKIIQVSREAGKIILDIYNKPNFEVLIKDDKSPLTEADKKANDYIVAQLEVLYPEIPFITEELKATDYSERKAWEYLWLIDPLDGTKEFIKRNGEFTVNIALIKNGVPVAGVIYIPVQDVTFFAVEGEGTYRINVDGTKDKLAVKDRGSILTLIGSRSHQSDDFIAYINEQKKQFETVEVIPAGSSLKFCKVAAGEADCYPRLGPTMEWDTGAGHIIATEAGATITVAGTAEPLNYNKENLLNPFFIVSN